MGTGEHHAMRGHSRTTSTRELLHHGVGHASHATHLGDLELGLEARLAILLALGESDVQGLPAGRGLEARKKNMQQSGKCI